VRGVPTKSNSLSFCLSENFAVFWNLQTRAILLFCFKNRISLHRTIVVSTNIWPIFSQVYTSFANYSKSEAYFIITLFQYLVKIAT
jgi:hypothetical protein